MKYCTKCGKELCDEAVICPGCGADAPKLKKETSTAPLALVLGILGIVFALILALVGHVLSIIGIVTGYREYQQTGRVAGLAVSIVGEVFCILSSLSGLIMAISMI